jgi:hypothetical protein
MTRKDYIAIAAVIYNCKEVHNRPIPVACIRDVADELQRDNPRFDRALFLDACGLTPREIEVTCG